MTNNIHPTVKKCLSANKLTLQGYLDLGRKGALKLVDSGPRVWDYAVSSADTVIVTRHASLLQFLVNRGFVSPVCRVIQHATEREIRGRHVIGVLPNRLACLALSITEIDLDLPADKRGVELTLEDLELYHTGITVYIVERDVQLQRNAGAAM